MMGDDYRAALKKVLRHVDGNSGVATLTMKELRDACGVQRLGPDVRTAIQEALKSLSLGHIPEELPGSAHAKVRLYAEGSQIGKVIRTILHPSVDGDTDIRRMIG